MSQMDCELQSLDQALFSEFFHRPENHGTFLSFGLKDRQPETYADFYLEVQKFCKSSVIPIARSKKFGEAVRLCYKKQFKVDMYIIL